MRSAVDILVGQVTGDNLASAGVDADMEFAPSAPPGGPCFSISHSPAPRSFRPLLSTIKWRGSDCQISLDRDSSFALKKAPSGDMVNRRFWRDAGRAEPDRSHAKIGGGPWIWRVRRGF